MPTIIIVLIVLCLALVIVGAALFTTRPAPGIMVLALGVAFYMVIDLVRGATGH